MRLYRVRKISHSRYNYMIFPSSYINPLEQRMDIEKELSNKNFKGFVVLDQLLCIGNTSTRFLEMYFNGKIIDFSSLKPVQENKHILQKIASEFYFKNYDKLDTSILTSPTKFKMRKGIAV